MIQIVKYNEVYYEEWEAFIQKTLNCTFLLSRKYLDYHGENINDQSLLFYENTKLIAIFPCNRVNNRIISHGGVTYGGLLFTEQLNIEKMIVLFEKMKEYFKNEGIVKIFYKSIPFIYLENMRGEELYALFRTNAELYRRDLSTTIDYSNVKKMNRGRKARMNKSKKFHHAVESIEPGKISLEFWQILEANLREKYNVDPTHSYEEMSYLAEKFPNNIKNFVVKESDEVTAGVILYLTKTVVHCQYISSNEKGKHCDSLLYLFSELMPLYKNSHKYFDFGTSNENQGKTLNISLYEFKKRFGSVSFTHDYYYWDIEG